VTSTLACSSLAASRVDVAGSGDSAFVSVYTDDRRELVASGDCR